MICDTCGSEMVEPPHSPKENYSCPRCSLQEQIDDLWEAVRELRKEVSLQKSKNR
jgi:hypothetical protein